eukprot:gene5683-5921_t
MFFKQVSVQNLDNSLNSSANPEDCWQLYRSILSFYSQHVPTTNFGQQVPLPARADVEAWVGSTAGSRSGLLTASSSLMMMGARQDGLKVQGNMRTDDLAQAARLGSGSALHSGSEAGSLEEGGPATGSVNSLSSSSAAYPADEGSSMTTPPSAAAVSAVSSIRPGSPGTAVGAAVRPGSASRLGLTLLNKNTSGNNAPPAMVPVAAGSKTAPKATSEVSDSRPPSASRLAATSPVPGSPQLERQGL